jgi:hypothetical protein
VTTAAELLGAGVSWARSEHPHAHHLERTLDWARELDAQAGDVVLLAALLHDIERAVPDPGSPFDSARDWSLDAYVDYHQGRSARHLARWMGERGAVPDDIAAAVALVAVHERGGWPEADLVQAADSLSFIETLTPLLREWIATGRSTQAGALAKLDFMWDRITVPVALERGRALYENARAEVS